jgi:hypothetical protein
MWSATKCALLALCGARAMAADVGDVVGLWDVRLSGADRGTQAGLLEITPQGRATLEAQPVELAFDGDEISFDYAQRTFGGSTTLSFSGTVTEGAMTGGAAGGDRSYTWLADRIGDEPGRPRLTGVWLGSGSLGGGGWQPPSPALTPAGEDRVTRFSEFDDPALRCVSVGLGQLFVWPYLLEIVEVDGAEEIVFLYEGEREVRRIYLDGRKHPATGSPFDGPMGYSVGRVQNRTLRIDTRNLTPALLDNAGELHHMGTQTRIDERYVLSDDGRYLYAELTLTDPLTLEEPIFRRRTLERVDEELAPYHCDPYSFFRQLHEQGEVDRFFEHEFLIEP